MSVAAATLKAVLEADTGSFTSGFSGALGLLIDFKGQLDAIDQAVKHFQQKMAIEMAGVTAGLTGAVLAAKPFESAMGDVSTLVDTSAMSMEELSNKVMSVAGILKDSTGGTATAAAEYQVLSAGITDVNDSLIVLEKSGKLAKGGLGSTEQAVDLVTTAINSYGKQAKDAENITDQFMITVMEGKTTISELAGTFGNVAPLAVTAGLGIEELNAATATLTQQGIKTGQAHTGLRAILSALIAPSSQASKLAKKLGIDFSIAGLQAKGLSGFLKDLNEKTGGNSEQLSTLFGQVEGLSAVLSLGGKGAESYARILKRLNTESGVTEKAFQKQIKPISTLLSNLRWLVTEIGNRLLPVVNAIITPINNIFEWFQKLKPELRSLVEWIGIIGAILFPFRMIITVLGIGLRYIGVILPPIMTVLRGIIPLLISGLRFIFPFLLRMIPILASVLGLTNPIGWAITGIIGLLAILQSNFLGLGDAVSKIWKALSTAFNLILNAIFPIDESLKALGINVNNFWDELGKILKAIEISLTQYIKKSVDQLVDGIYRATTFITNLLLQLKIFIITLIDSITQWINRAINWVQQQFNSLLKFFGGFKKALITIFDGMFGGIFSQIDNLLTKYDDLIAKLKEYIPIAWAAAKIMNPNLQALEDIIKGAMKAYDSLGKATKKHHENNKKGNKDNNKGLGETNDKLKKQKDLLNDINRVLAQNFRLAMARAWKNRGSWINSLNFPWSSSKPYGAQIGPNGVLSGGTQYNQGRGTLQPSIVYKFVINGQSINIPGPQNPTADQRREALDRAWQVYDALDGIIGNQERNKAKVSWTNP